MKLGIVGNIESADFLPRRGLFPHGKSPSTAGWTCGVLLTKDLPWPNIRLSMFKQALATLNGNS